MKEFRMSFSSGGLNFHESLEIANLYLELRDWEEVKKLANETNVLQSRTSATSKRSVRETVFRLQKLSQPEFELFIEGSADEQKSLLWLSICRTYPFIGEFSIKVLRESFLSMKGWLNYEDFDYFFNKKADEIQELEELSDSTREKLRQVLFRMMREANILTSTNSIIPALLSPNLVETIKNTSDSDLLFFPIYDQELKRLGS